MLADDKTKIIPGHRSVSSKQELKVYKIMLITLRNRVQEAINKGKSFNDVSNDSNITKEYKKEYWAWFISAKKIRETIYKSLKDKKWLRLKK